MRDLMLFIDGSVNTQSHIGYGAYLALSEPGLSLDELRSCIKIKRFEQTSSTKLELQTLLWALSEITAAGNKLMIYTDSQNIIGLPARRERLEQNDYCSRNGRALNDYQLYQEFYRMTDPLDYQLIKVQGHQQSNQKTVVDQIFTLVDRASRQALREESR